MAELCIELGYSDSNLGYQTFLHSNGNELKKVFIFLIEKLPKDREKSGKVAIFLDVNVFI